MSDDSIVKVKIDLARGFAAMKVLLDERDQDIAQLRTELRDRDERLRSLELKLTTLETEHKNTREQTGRFEKIRDEQLKAQGATAVVEKTQTHQIEKLKATAPLWVAVVSGVFGLLAGIISLLTTLLGSGH
jgi:septal ring factor EnvC (AmiA/AmiB activator)